MDRLLKVKKEVERLYSSNNPNADEWISWGYPNHVLVVAEHAEKLARRHNANLEYCVAGALLHDIADVEMDRDTPVHETRSLEIASVILASAGFSEDDISDIVNGIIEPHSCSALMPKSLEGKIVATADGLAHFVTDFYTWFCWQHYGPDEDYQKFKSWVSKKIEKDYRKKIFFEDARQLVQPQYDALKLLFSQ